MALIISLSFVLPAHDAIAHPHVWVTARSILLFDNEGNLTEVHHYWTFDKAYSAYITTGLDTNRDGILSEEELAPLAEENTVSLVDFGYFTKLKIKGKDQKFNPPKNYKMMMQDGQLVQYFELPLAVPAPAPKIIGFEAYDESFFVSFSLENTDKAVTLTGPIKGCTITISRPKQEDIDALSKYSEDYFANAGMGAQFSNKAVIACP
ncbi:DUF1007 family protein [Microvirga sp. W0021]|uniref:DUF1007 family protein n=1 Tax=Hohaiivirga grylli TaxID=3133970 RepID=A0ABV0BLS3_9HYPH